MKSYDLFGNEVNIMQRVLVVPDSSYVLDEALSTGDWIVHSITPAHDTWCVVIQKTELVKQATVLDEAQLPSGN